MKPLKIHTTSVAFPLAYAIAGLMASSVIGVQAADQFFDGSTTNALTAAKWAATNAGPFTSAFTTGSTAVFATVNGTGTGAGGITVGGIRAEESFTLNSPSGTLATGGTVATVDVFSGKTLDFGTLALSTASGTGFIKSGSGVLATAGGAYTGGFTLNDGTVILRGVNAMGAGGALTINGGTIAANATRDLTGKYTGGTTVGGNFTLGATTGLAVSAANLTFTNDMALGSSTRTITIGGNGVYTLGGVISGATGTGLIVDAAAGGRLTLTGANSYDGGTTIKGGILGVGAAVIGTYTHLGTGTVTLGDASGSKDATLYGSFATNNNTYDNALTLAAGSSGNTLAIVGANASLNFTNAVALNNNLTLANQNFGKIITLSGLITQTSAGSPALTITNGATITGTTATAALTGQAVLSGGIVIGTGGLTLVNNASQTFTVGAGNITSSTTGNLTFNANGTGAFTISAASINHEGSITNSGSSSGTTTISASGAIGAKVTGLTQNSSTSTLIISAANSAFTGGTTVTAGTLNLRNTNSLQNSVLNMNGGSVSFGTSTAIGLTSVALGGLAGSSNINLNNFLTVPTAVNLTIGNSSGQNPTYSGALSNTNGAATLTKVGTNTQTLSGANTYTGATLVSEGTLALTAGSEASPITVSNAAFLGFAPGSSITTSSSVTLDAGAKIKIIGTPVSPTSYTLITAALGITGTPELATAIPNYTLSLESGNTVLKLNYTGGGSSYASWANDPLKGNIPGEPATGDFDNDGISNIVEYALGKNPRISSQPAGVLSGNTVTFTKGADAIANADVSWTIETSTTLAPGSWTNAPGAQPPGDSTPTIIYTFTPSTPEKNFARLKVTQN